MIQAANGIGGILKLSGPQAGMAAYAASISASLGGATGTSNCAGGASGRLNRATTISHDQRRTRVIPETKLAAHPASEMVPKAMITSARRYVTCMILCAIAS